MKLILAGLGLNVFGPKEGLEAGCCKKCTEQFIQ